MLENPNTDHVVSAGFPMKINVIDSVAAVSPEERGVGMAESSTPSKHAAADGQIEISVRGEWITVPAMNFGGKVIIAKGKWIRIAQVHDEQWLETELEDPQGCIERLKE